ncbi:MAG: pectin acetylesterase [Lachnospiraceae bacterium]|nr:pectin acetylesterase [Lachnospiraceae bacterium]
MTPDFLHKKTEGPTIIPPLAEPGQRLKSRVWYRVNIPDGISGDGSEYHIYVKRAPSKDLCIFLSGGGIAWNEYTAARPVTTPKMLIRLPNYYWSNLRPVTQIMNINIGITQTGSVRNPFNDWNFIVIPYSTGDLHLGNNDFVYHTDNGEENILHFHGYSNFRSAMDAGASFFPEAKRILIAGNSAGAFAVPALAGDIADLYYPDCSDITLFSDSGQLLYKKWKKTLRDVWKTDKRFWSAVHSENITLDFYRALFKKYGNRFRCLYSSSTRDYLLSTYYNDVTNKIYKTDRDVQDAFFAGLQKMIKELKELSEDFGIYIDPWKFPFTQGGTVHTAVRELYFAFKTVDGITMARWLADAVSGDVYDVGMKLLL